MRMQESDPELWDTLTKDIDNTSAPDLIVDSDSDSDDEDEREQLHKPGLPYPSVIRNANGPSISMENIVEIVHGEGK